LQSPAEVDFAEGLAQDCFSRTESVFGTALLDVHWVAELRRILGKLWV